MKIKKNIGIFSATNSLKVLSCLSDYPEKEFSGSELQKSTGLSRGGVYLSLKELKKQGLISALNEYIKNRKPFLGICLGMQLLFEESEEATESRGLGVLKGKVKKFKELKEQKLNKEKILLELSKPTISASGHRSCRTLVLLPGPHPMSIIDLGLSTLIFVTRSIDGWVLSLLNFKYC